MKKTVRIFAVAIVAIMLCLSLTSCFGTKLSGEYESKVDVGIAEYQVVYEFKGSKVTVTEKSTVIGNVKKNTYEGTYKIEGKDDEMEITFDFEDEGAVAKDGTKTLKIEDDYIVIGGQTYVKDVD